MRPLFVFVAFLGAASVSSSAQAPRPELFPALRDSAVAMRARGQWAASAALYQRLAIGDSSNGDYWSGLGASEAALGHIDGALHAFKHAWHLGFGNRAARAYQIAALHAKQRDRDSTLAWLTNALDNGFAPRRSLVDSTFSFLAGDSAFRRLTLADAWASASTARWAGDLDVLVDEAHRLYPKPVRPQHRFDSLAAEARAQLKSARDGGEAYATLQRVVAALGNGHSVLFPLETNEVPLRMIPIDLYAFTDATCIVDAAEKYRSLVGQCVDSVNGVATSRALQATAPLIDRDNPMGLLAYGPYFLTYPALLASVGIPGPRDSVRLSLRHGTATRLITVAVGDFRPPQKLGPPASPHRPPLYLSRPDAAYWFTTLPADHAVYIQYNQVVDDSARSASAFARTILDTLTRLRAHAVIVDVRRNNGGSSQLAIPLLRSLLAYEAIVPQGQIYVLTGRGTFSAAQNFVNWVDRFTHALFVGEPTGSAPAFVGEDTPIELPFSGINGSIASRYFQDGEPSDRRIWIAPDIPVRPSSTDYFSDRDPVLAAALAHSGLRTPGRGLPGLHR